MIELIIVTAIALWVIVGGMVYMCRGLWGSADLIEDSRWAILAHGPAVWAARLLIKLYWGI